MTSIIEIIQTLIKNKCTDAAEGEELSDLVNTAFVDRRESIRMIEQQKGDAVSG